MGCGGSIDGNEQVVHAADVTSVRTEAYPPGVGCSIERTEERGITVSQLGAVQTQIESHCVVDEWTDRQTKEALKPESVNLYHLTAELIKPVTKARQCSYVEVVAKSAQPPKWFVSHWWGEPVLSFVACLRRHCELRSPGNVDLPYWVCAYANNQWKLAEDVSSDPATSAFNRALDFCIGTVTVLDKGSQTYSRIWCGFEIAATLQAKEKLYDVVTALEYEDPLEEITHRAVAITDGQAVGYTDANGSSWQQEHEANFPLHLAENALSIRLQDAQASVELDRRRILNCIAGAADPDAQPCLRHPKYDVINGVLRGRFASAALRNAIDHGRTTKLVVALQESRLQSLSWDFSNCDKLSDDVLGHLAEVLPLELESCSLQLRSCTGLTQAGLAKLARALMAAPSLQRLRLDLFGTEAGGEVLKCFAEGSPPPQLAELKLRLTGCQGITDLEVQRLVASLRERGGIQTVELHLGETQVSKEVAQEACCTLRGKGVDVVISVRSR